MKASVIVGATILSLAALIGWQGIYKPRKNAIGALYKQMEDEKKAQATQAELATMLSEFEAERAQLSPEPDAAWLTRMVVGVAKEAGINLKQVNKDKPLDLKDFTHITISVEMEGDYHDLGRFVDALERAEAALWVEKLVVKPLDDREPVLFIQMTVGTLYAKSAADIL